MKNTIVINLNNISYECLDRTADGTNCIYVEADGEQGYSFYIGDTKITADYEFGRYSVQIPDQHIVKGNFVIDVRYENASIGKMKFVCEELSDNADIMVSVDDGTYCIRSKPTNDIDAESIWKMVSSYVKEAILERDKERYRVGKILMTTENINPATYLGFGTWTAWGTGRVPVGVNANDTNFNTVEKTGGAKSVDLSHAHTVNSHVHTGPSHKHTVDAHVHSTGNHTLTVSEIPAHAHTVTRNFPYGQDWGGGTAWSANSSYQNSPNNMTMTCGNTGGGKAHNHGNTGSASPSTSAAGTGNTGAAAPGTNSQLSAAQSILQPYITCYMWKRTA